jgi:DNA-binding response OmpR family regulator
MTTEEAHKRLRELSMGEPSILIVERDVLSGIIIRDILQKVFPHASITVAEEFGTEDIDKTLEKRFDVVFLDSDLSGWQEKHPIYENWGFNLIPAIREIKKDTIIVAISDTVEHNEEGIRKGADMIFPKSDFQKKPLTLL